jgi:hypothetical protein
MKTFSNPEDLTKLFKNNKKMYALVVLDIGQNAHEILEEIKNANDTEESIPILEEKQL